jgi:predicted dehydrogenase
MSKLKIGVIGGGHIVVHRHLPIFRKLVNVEVSAICDKQESTAKEVAAQFGVANTYCDLADMLKMEKLDVVDICTPPQTHFNLATQAMENGCNILAEKPLAMNVAEVDEMYRIAQKNNVRLCVVHQNLFNPAVQRAKRLLENGELGDVLSVDVGTFVRRDNYMCLNDKHWCHTLPGGIFFEILPHPVYLIQLFSKKPEPLCVLAKKLNEFTWMKADELKVLMKAEKGVGSIVASCNSPFHGDSLNILGTKLGLQVDLWGRSLIKYKARTQDQISVGKSNLYLASQLFGLLATNVTNSSKAVLGGVKVSAHYNFISAFVTSILEESRLPVSQEEAVENVRIVRVICDQMLAGEEPSVTLQEGLRGC